MLFGAIGNALAAMFKSSNATLLLHALHAPCGRSLASCGGYLKSATVEQQHDRASNGRPDPNMLAGRESVLPFLSSEYNTQGPSSSAL